MQKYFYPIFKLPTFYERDYVKEELPLYVKWWLLGKAGRELSQILTGSEFTLLHTLNKKFKILQIKGQTEQEQLTGKNLFKKIPNDTIGGIELTQLENGIQLNGTSNASTYKNFSFESDIVLPAGTYTIYYKTSRIPINIGLYGENYTNIFDRNISQSYENVLTMTLSEEKTIKGFRTWIDNGVTFNNEFLQIMILKGNVSLSNALPYEAYCGGIPSPNPDYPQPIKNVTGNANVKIQNKNLAWTGWAEDFVSRINNIYQARLETKDNKNCLRYGAAAGYGDYDNKYMFKIPFKPNTQYTFVFDLLAEINTGNIAIQYTDNTTTSLTNIPVNSWNKVILASVANKTIKYLRVQYNNGACWMDLDTFMVLEGAYTSETIPSYVEHQEQNYPFTFAEGQRAMQGTTLHDDGIHNTRGRIILDGTENWEQRRNSINVKQFYCFVSSSKLINKDNIKCNYAKYNEYTFNYGIVGRFDIGINDKQLFICVPDELTIEQFKSMIAENNLIIEGSINEEIIPYNETQQGEYEAIKQAKTYKDVTYITSESDELPPLLDIQYWKERGTEE